MGTVGVAHLPTRELGVTAWEANDDKITQIH